MGVVALHYQHRVPQLPQAPTKFIFFKPTSLTGNEILTMQLGITEQF